MLAVTEPDDERLRSVRLMITGGDLANPADCQGSACEQHPGARLLNAYGLTETTITSALFDVGPSRAPAAGAPVPVGKPIRHSRIMVLDENLSPVPPGQRARSSSAAAASPGGTWAGRSSPQNSSCPTATASPAAGCTAPETSGAGVRTATCWSPGGWTAS